MNFTRTFNFVRVLIQKQMEDIKLFIRNQISKLCVQQKKVAFPGEMKRFVEIKQKNFLLKEINSIIL